MIFSFVLFKAIPLVSNAFPDFGSVGRLDEKKSKKKITISLRIGGSKPQHHGPFRLIATPRPFSVDKVSWLLPLKKKSSIVTTQSLL